MILTALTTLFLLAVALAWSLRLLWRERDRRLALLPLLIAAVAAHNAAHYAPLLQNPAGWNSSPPASVHDLVALLVAALALLLLVFLHRLLRDRAATSAALLQSENRLRQLFESTQDAILLTDSVGNYIDANPASEALLGYSRDQLLALKTADVLASQSSPGWQQGSDGRGHVRFIRADRRTRIGEFSTKRVAPGLHMTILRDVTEQRLAQDELRRSRLLIQSALDALAGHVAVVDDQGRIVAVNAVWRRFAADSGVPESVYSAGAVYLDAWRAAAGAPLDEQTLSASIAQVIADGSDRIEFEHAADGPERRRWFMVHVSRFDMDGRRYAVVSHEEITRLKLVQEALRRSEAEARRLAAVAALTDNATMILDAGGRLEWVNEAFARAAGASPADLIGRTVDSVLAEADPDAPGLAKRLAGGRGFSTEATIRAPGGERWYALDIRPIPEPDGHPVSFVGVASDITERRRAERDYRSLFELAGDAILVIDPDTETVLDVNQRACELYGFPPDAFVGMNLQDITENIPRGRERIGDILRTGGTQDLETVHRRADGSRMTLLINAAVIEFRARSALLIIARDITEARRAEAELRASEALNRRILENVPGGLVRVAADGAIIQANGEAQRFLGLSWDDLSKRFVADFEPATIWEDGSPCPASEYPVARCLATGEPQPPATIGVQRPDGRIGWAVFTAVPLVDPHTGRLDGAVVSFLDITERRAAEEALRESEERFRAAAGCAGDLIYEVDAAVEHIGWFGNVDEALGYEPGEYPRTIDGWLATVHPEDRPAVQAAIARSLASHIPFAAEYRIYRKDGQLRRWVARALPVTNDAGQLVKWVGVTTDVTELRELEAQRERLLARLRLQFDRMPVACIVFDQQMHVLEWNPAAEKIFGHTRDEVRGRDAVELLVPPSARGFVQQIVERVARGDMSADAVNENVTRDGRIILCHWRNTPLLDDNGAHLGLLSMVQDITEQKLAEDRLRDSEERYRRLVQSAPLAILVHQEGRFVYANDRALALFGAASADELLGTPVMDRVHPDFRDAVTERIHRLRAYAEEASPLHQRLVRLDGAIVDAEIAGTACTYNGSPAIQIAALDTTERRKLEEDLRRAQKMEAVGQLASGVAHDFNNLLTAIFGFTGLAKRTLREDHPATRSLERVEEAARHAAGVTRALLTFTRETPSSKEPVRLERVVEESLRLLRRTLPANIELHSRLAPGPLWVRADATQLQQVVLNLAINARDAMPAGGALTVSADFASPEHNGNGHAHPPVRLAVTDTGVGMSPDVVARAFEPFFTTKPPGEGTGLGLAIVHGIVKDHGGGVQVHSEPGRGSTFTVTLPGAPPAAPAAAPHSLPAAQMGQGELIIVVDDHRFIRELISSMLTNIGYRVLQASDGESFLNLHAQLGREARLIVLDTDLPRRGGLDCLRSLRDAGDATPAILMTGNANTPGLADLDARTAVLAKPFQMADLAAAVHDALRSSRPAAGERT